MDIEETLEEIMRLRHMRFPKFDVLLKSLFSVKESGLKTLLDVPDGTPISEEFGRLSSHRVDSLIESGGVFYHTEFQTCNEEAMHWRMLNYLQMINGRHGSYSSPVGLALRQFVLYIGPDPVDMFNQIRGKDINFRFELKDIREFERHFDALSASSISEDKILALLCKPKCDHDEWMEVARHVRGLPKDKAADMLALLLVASLLRPLEIKTKLGLEKMASVINVRKSKVFEEVFTDGEAKGEFEEAMRAALENCEDVNVYIDAPRRTQLSQMNIHELRHFRRAIVKEKADFDSAAASAKAHSLIRGL